jgi:non-specific serine/threonine protein kinase
MEREHDNLRAALGWVLDCGEVQLSLRLGIGFAPFWWARGYYGEGRRWMARVVGGDQSSPASLEPGATRYGLDIGLDVLRAWALWWMGKLVWNQDDIVAARGWARECLAAARTSGDTAITALALSYAGAIECSPRPGNMPPGDPQRGAALLADAVALGRLANDHEVLVRVLGDRFGALVDMVQELDQALTLAEELLDVARHLDTLTSLNVQAYVDSNLAAVAQRQGDVSSARSYAERALLPVREHGFRVWAVECLRILAWVADQMGIGARAARLFGACATEAERQGIVGYVEYVEHAATRAATRAMMDEDAWAAAFAAGRALALEQAVAEALGTEVVRRNPAMFPEI